MTQVLSPTPASASAQAPSEVLTATAMPAAVGAAAVPHALPSLNGEVLILGLGISGLSMARWCAQLGASVTVLDTRQQPPELAALQQLASTGADIRFECGSFSAERIHGSRVRAVFKSPGLAPAQVAPLVDAAKASGLWVGGELSLFNHALRGLQASAGYAPKVLAITGTNGKTTTTTLTGLLVERAGQSVAVAGNIGPALLDTLRERLGDLPQVWVLELSSFQLDGVDDFEPTAATVLNLTQNHLDWHGSMQAYARAKENIYGKDKAQTQIHVTSSVPTQLDEYGIESVAGMDWLVRAVPDQERSDAMQARANQTRPGKKARAGQALAGQVLLQRLMPADALRLRGLHNRLNALAALALAVRAGCALAPMLYGLREYRGEPHRMESVGFHHEVEYVDDSKGTNIGATIAAVTSLSAGQRGKKMLLILGGDGKGQDFSALAPVLAQHVRAVVLIGRDAPQIEAALQHTPDLALHRAALLEEAVQLCARLARAGDIVLLSPACASLDMFKDYKHRAAVFVQSVQAL